MYEFVKMDRRVPFEDALALRGLQAGWGVGKPHIKATKVEKPWS